MKKTDQISRTHFFEKYGGLSLYDIYMNKIYKFCHGDICFVKKNGCYLIGNTGQKDGTSMDHEYFFIQDDLFDQTLSTDQNNNVTLNIIPKDILFPSINDISIDSIIKLRKRCEMFSSRHILQRKLQKTVNDYSNKSIDDFKLIVVYPLTKLTGLEKQIIATSFGYSSQDQII